MDPQQEANQPFLEEADQKVDPKSVLNFVLLRGDHNLVATLKVFLQVVEETSALCTFGKLYRPTSTRQF